MAIAINEPVAEVASTSNASSYAFGAFTPTANALLVVVVFGAATLAAGTMTGGSLTWTKITSVAYAAGVNTAYIFKAQVGGSPSSTTITFDCTGDAATGAIMHCFQVTGHNAGAPVAQFKTNTASSTNATTGTLNRAANTNNGYIAAWSGALGSNVSTPPTSWTETADTSITNPSMNGSAAFRATGETATSFTFTNATTNWGCVFVEINEATQGGPRNGAQFSQVSRVALTRAGSW